MIPFLTRALAVLALAVAQTLLGRWTSTALPMVLFPALAAGAVLALPYRPALRLVLLAALAAELGSGLPTGSAGGALVLASLGLLAVVRRARLVLPLALQGMLGCGLTALVLVTLTLAFDDSPWPRPLASLYVLARWFVPSVIGGFLTAGVVALLRRAPGRTLVRALGIQSAP